MENNQPIALTPKSFIKTITVIHLALIMGLLLFSGVSYTLVETNFLSFDFENDIFSLIVPAFAIGGAFASNFIANKKISELSAIESLKDKLIGYQTASIIRFALLEGPALLGIVIYLQTGNLFYLLIAGTVIAYFVTVRPTKDKIEMDLNFSFEQKAAFNQMDEVIK